MAAESQKRRYRSDWVYTFVEGNGKEFDFGMDYTECGICKFFHVHGADEFTPFLCLLDFPYSKVSGWGLVRTMTPAEGDEKCDFRFKRGREVKQGWPPDSVERDISQPKEHVRKQFENRESSKLVHNRHSGDFLESLCEA